MTRTSRRLLMLLGATALIAIFFWPAPALICCAQPEPWSLEEDKAPSEEPAAEPDVTPETSFFSGTSDLIRRLRLRIGTGVDFGDDTSSWSNDGQCDDPRFHGEGMAGVLLERDRGHDATDCRNLFDQGRIRVRSEEGRSLPNRIRASLGAFFASLFSNTISAEQPAEGRLEPGDSRSATGRYEDSFELQGAAGARVRLELTSSDFDPLLRLHAPGGEVLLENDDFEGSTSRSVIELTLSESGRHRVVVTSYAADTTGAYRLTLDTPRAGNRTAGERTFGIFVGVGDYGDRLSGLNYTGEDATRVRNAIVRGSGMNPADTIVLRDREATTARLEAAMADMAGRMGPDDMLVFFFSGHGDRVTRWNGPDAADPDGLDETIELFDGAVRDDELARMLDGISGKVLIVLDSCYSGGFAKDVISAPGRMGMFSSEEDVVSSVAREFQAGGYLAHFFDEAIGSGRADLDRDRAVTAIELSQYVHERYRSSVKTASNSVAVPDTSYQHLVVDRSGIGPYDVLFRLGW